MQPFPHPNVATHKIWSRLANWLQRYSSSKVWNFRHSGASNSKMSGLIQPKIELDRALMPVLVTSNFDDDSKKLNELAWRHHFPIVSLFFRRSRAANSVDSGPIWPKLELVQNFKHVLVTCKYKKDLIKSKPRKGGETIFPIKSQWGLSVAMDTRVLIQSASKHYAAFPHPQWCYT